MSAVQEGSASAGPSLAGALAMANRGVAVFPVWGIRRSGPTERDARCACPNAACKSPGKHPIGEGWQDKATCDNARIRTWHDERDCNFGVLLGERSRVAVVEVDPYDGGRLRDLPVRPTVVSTSGRGHHAYYLADGVPNGTRLGPGMTVRSDGYFVVAPGSMHYTGRRYGRRAWGFDDFLRRPALTLPDGLDLRASGPSVSKEMPEEILDGQQRWRHLLSLAGSLASRGLTESEIFDALVVMNEKRCRPPKPESDLRRLAKWVGERSTPMAEPREGAPSSWAPVDLAAVADGTLTESPPSILERTDNVAILYRGKRHLLAGEPEGGKGWLAMRAAAARMALHESVLYLDFEDSAVAAISRLTALGVPLQDVLEWFVYVRPDGPLDVDPSTLAPGATLAVIDGVTEAMQLLGLNPYDNRETATFFAQLARPLADAGAAVLMIDHVVKDRDNRGRWAIGAQHKMAGSDVCFALEVIRPFGRGLAGGLSRLTLTKDRPGFLRQHAAGRSRLGDVHLDSDGDGVTVRIEPPQDTTESGFRPTYYMERVSQYLEGYPSGQTQNAVEADVRGKRDYIRAALTALVGEGFVSRADGPRGSFVYASIRPFRESS